jgi:RNA polymerase sigma-70 factor, ECF subfamily
MLATRYTAAKNIDLEAIVSKYYAALYRFGFALAKNEGDAADLTQETFRLLTKRQGQIRAPERLKSWLFTTLRREFLRMNRIRRAHPEVAFQPDEQKLAAMEPDVLGWSDGRTAWAALEQVQETYRPAVELFYLADLSYKEIAATLGVPVGTVMSRLSRGKEQLKRALATPFASASGKIIPAPSRSAVAVDRG